MEKKDFNNCFLKIKVLIPHVKIRLNSAVVADQTCNRLNLPYSINTAAQEIAKKIQKMDIQQGKHLHTLAGLAVFMACQLTKTKNKCSL